MKTKLDFENENLLLLFGLIVTQCLTGQDLLLPSGNNHKFKNTKEGLHYIIVRLKPVLQEKVATDSSRIKNSAQQVKSELDQANASSPEKGLRTSLIYLSNENFMEPIITIRRFGDFAEAKAYSAKLLKLEVLENGVITEIIPISQINYRICLATKTTRTYSACFEELTE